VSCGDPPRKTHVTVALGMALTNMSRKLHHPTVTTLPAGLRRDPGVHERPPMTEVRDAHSAAEVRPRRPVTSPGTINGK
jgi:hypothetical protein